MDIYNVIIIGGGISGLFLLKNLVEKKNKKIILLEKQDSVGGKCQTEYESSGRVRYEKGPWRILSDHPQMFKLCKELNQSIEPFPSSLTYWKNQVNKIPDIQPRISTLSTEQVWIWKKGIFASEEINRKTGYHDILEMVSTINAYDPNHCEKNYFPRNGFSGVVQKLYEKTKSYCQCNSFVKDIQYKKPLYSILVLVRTGPNQWKEITMKCKTCIIAVPPSASQKWSLLKDLNIYHSISSYPLCHIYAHIHYRKMMYQDQHDFHIMTEDPNSQIISSPYQNDWFQLSYSGGTLAEYWDNLYYTNVSQYKKKLVQSFQKYFPSCSISTIKKYFWQEAIHYWKPSFQFSEKKFYHLGLYPDPIRLPNLFFVGEAFSRNQGWCEGALQSVLDFFSLWRKPFVPLQKIPVQYVIYKNKLLDVEPWMDRHPGGREAIQNHLFEDISELWDTIHHSSKSQQILLGLQVGWKDKDTFYEIPS